MIKFDVLNRYSGEVQFTAEIDCSEDTERSWKLRLSVLWAIEHKANMRYADMSGANMSGANMRGANMIGADMSGANMRGADMRCANMICANMSCANMSSANMSCANMSCANMSGAKLALVHTDIWTVYVQPETIRIGCQYHKASEWFGYSDADIAKMEGRALDWWKKWKVVIKAAHEVILKDVD